MSIIGRKVVVSGYNVGVVIDQYQDKYLIEIDGKFQEYMCSNVNCFLEKYKGDDKHILSVLKGEQERRKRVLELTSDLRKKTIINTDLI